MLSMKRTMIFAAAFFTFATMAKTEKATENYIYNSSFEFGEKISDALSWHRMKDIPYIMHEDSGWKLDSSDAFDGKRCIMTEGRNAKSINIPLELYPSEENKKTWVFSLYAKSDRNDFPFEIRIGLYNGLNCNYSAKQFNAAKEWKRYELVLDKKLLFKKPYWGLLKGPFNISVTPKEDGQFKLDALQLENSATASKYTRGTMENGRPGEKSVKTFEEIQHTHMKLKELLPDEKENIAGTTANTINIPFIVNSEYPKKLSMAAISGGLPFKEGVCYESRNFILSDSNGREINFQNSILSRWPYDNSIRSLGIFFESDLQTGINKFTLSYRKNAEKQKENPPLINPSSHVWNLQAGNVPFSIQPSSGILCSTKRKNFELKAHGLDGKIFSSSKSPGVITELEYNGPVYASVMKKGILSSEDGEGLLEFECRMHFYHNRPGVEIETCIINPYRKGTIIARDIYLQADSGITEKIILPIGKACNTFLEYYSETDKNFFSTSFNSSAPSIAVVKDAARMSAWISNGGSFLSVSNPWKKHPVMMNIENNSLNAYFWPRNPGMGIFFARGMSISRNFLFLENVKNPEDVLLQQGVHAILPDKAYFSQTDFFMIPLGYNDSHEYPVLGKFIEKANAEEVFSPDGMEKRKLYGLFDYGDILGDGGWGNLESFVDYTAFINALCSQNDQLFSLGCIGAEHYRDMDIDQNTGLCRYHTLNHVLNNQVTFCHSWPQGVYTHYLFTGSCRSRNVALLTGLAMLETPVELESISGARALARYLLNLTDLYALCGSNKLKDRFFRQLAYAEEALIKRNTKDKTIFPWSGRLDPFHLWYGATAMMEMYKLTKDERLLKSITREIETSLNMDFYKIDMEESWPGASGEEAWPLVLAYRARHRGSLFYPLMNFYSELTQNPFWLELASKAAYADFFQDYFKKTPCEIFKFSVLNSGNRKIAEAELCRNVKDLVFQSAAPTLLNGDFGASTIWWKYWNPYANRQMAYDSLIGKWDINTAGSLENMVKEYYESKREEVSPWQFYRRTLAKLDNETYHAAPPSLCINIDTLSGLQNKSGSSLESAKTRITPGKWKITGAFKYGTGIRRPVFLNVMFNDGSQGSLQFPLEENAKVNKSALPSGTSIIQPESISISLPNTKGWQLFTCKFDFKQRGILYLRFHLALDKNSKKGKFNIDDLKLEKYE